MSASKNSTGSFLCGDVHYEQAKLLYPPAAIKD
jgi:hypothetical protein